MSSERTLRGTDERGIFTYVLAETQEELQDLRRTIDDHLATSPNKNSIAVALPSEATGDLAQVLLKRKTLKSIDPQKKRQWGTTACNQLEQRWDEQLNTRLRQILQSCSYHCITLNKIPVDKQNQPSWIVSTLLKELYPFVPPVNGIEKLRSNHPTGKKIVKSVANQLLADTLSPQTLQETSYKTVTDSIFVSSWGLLRKTSNKYIPQEPKDENLKAAWSELERLTDLAGEPEKSFNLVDIWKVLSQPPYGYSEYNFAILFSAWLAYHRKEVMLKGPIAVKRSRKQQVSVRQQPLKDWANTDLFHNPITFVTVWVVQDKAKLFRKEGVTLPELPKSPMDFGKAQDYLDKANQFLESTEAEPEELVGVRRTKEKVEAALEPVTTWFQSVESAESLTGDVEIETHLRLYQQLKQPLPSYSLDSNVISVRPTVEQRSRHDAVSQAMAASIEQHIEEMSLQSENLESMEACDTYQVDVQNLINTFQQTPELPDHLKDSLQYALKVAERVRGELQENARIKQLLETARAKARPLNDYSSQTNFIQVISELEALCTKVPADRPEAGEIQNLLQDVDQQYQELNQKLETWEERLTSATTQDQIITLLQETAKHRERFTDNKSQEQLSNLEKKLNNELSGIETKSQTETLLKAELDNARQHLQRLRDLSEPKIIEAFQAYQELKGFQFSSVEDKALIQEYQKRLENFKNQGYELIFSRFQQVCDRKLTRLELYEDRKEALNRALFILEDIDNFETIKTNLTQSLSELEDQAKILRQQAELQKKRAEDEKTFKEIRQLKPDQNSSIHICEEALKRIQVLKTSLHDHEQFHAEINQITQACQEKIQSHHKSLNQLKEQLAAVNNNQLLDQLQFTYVRLESVFRDASGQTEYEMVGAIIRDIKSDLQTINKLENRCTQANSIAMCNEILEDLAASKDLLKKPERFQESHLSQLAAKVQQKKGTYRKDLTQLEQELPYISTPAALRQLQETLLKQSSHYIGSEEEERVDALKSEIDELTSLMPLITVSKARNLETCRNQIQKLVSLKESSNNIPQHLRDRMESALEVLEKRRQKFLIEKQNSARNWLQNMNSKLSKMQNAIRENKKYEIASEILATVKDEKKIYVEFLDVSECKLLFDIERQSLEEQNKHTSNQIITLFRQLSKPQREQLYRQLEQYLSDQTEEDLSGKAEEGWWQRLFRSDNQKTNQND